MKSINRLGLLIYHVQLFSWSVTYKRLIQISKLKNIGTYRVSESYIVYANYLPLTPGVKIQTHRDFPNIHSIRFDPVQTYIYCTGVRCLE